MQQSSKSGKQIVTEFKCKICGFPIRFSIDDPSTYESMTLHSDYFGMHLTTVRVVHETPKERHYNAIVIDHMGFFRGYRDAYSEPLVSSASSIHQNLVIHPSQVLQLSHHKYIELLILVDRQRFWVQTYICPDEFKPEELARLVMERVEEAEKIYDQPQRYLTFTIADMEFHIWISEDRVVFTSVKNNCVLPALEGLATGLLDGRDTAYTNQRAIRVALQGLESRPEMSPNAIHRFVTDSLIFTVAATPYQDRINRIVDRVSIKIPLAKTILRPLLMGQSSLIDVLEDGHWSEIPEAFEMIDFINRRGLLG